MNAIMVMVDSLNRAFLPCYGNDWVQAPNFQRLAERTVVFDRSYVGSMPCMRPVANCTPVATICCIAVGGL